MHSRFTRSLAAAALLALLPGCIERKEKIRISDSGAVTYRLELSGDPGDFDAGDALPTERGGWRVEERTEVNDDGEKKRFLVAERRIERDAEQPGDYAEDDEMAEIALRFPTTLTVERREDGVYYQFARSYAPRAAARYDYFRKVLENSSNAAMKKNLEEMSEAELTDVLTRLRGVEALQRAEYVRAGAEALAERWPLEYELRLRQSLIRCFEQMDAAPLVALLRDQASENRDKAIEREAQRIVELAREALEDELQALDVPRREREQFFAAYDLEEQRRQVTEDISDERFVVEIEMPGEIVAHNGLSAKDATVTWEFGGQALLDREERLLVISRVAAGERPVTESER